MRTPWRPRPLRALLGGGGAGRPGLVTDDRVLDVGSMNGFSTDVLARIAERVYALDLQPAMAAYYRAKGLPEPVSVLVADAARLPLRDDAEDVGVATMPYHELPSAALPELARVLRPGGRLAVVVDWTSAGTGADGPPLEERDDAWTAGAAVADAGFTGRRVHSRRQTFLLKATR